MPARRTIPRPQLILPRGVRRSASGLTVLVPRGYERDEAAVAVCRVPVDANGRTCGRLFYRGEEEAWQAHVHYCAKEHIDVIRNGSLGSRFPIFNPDNWDPEAEAYLRKVGDRMIREGRLTLKKNERLDG